MNGSDLPYGALFGEDPAPARDHVFYVSGLAEGTRHSGVLDAMERGGLGHARCNFRSRGTQACTFDLYCCTHREQSLFPGHISSFARHSLLVRALNCALVSK